MSMRARTLSLVVLIGLTSSACAGRINDTVWLPFAQWSEANSVGRAISQSEWLFAIIESFHLTGLALLGGAILVVDFRLLGLGLSDEPAGKLARDAQPWLFLGLIIMIGSGVMLYLSEATKFYSPGFSDSAEFPFIYKMLFLALALVFTFTIRRWVVAVDDARRNPALARLTGAISMLLWLGVGIGGRGIGFY
jgi:hypothetical protein